ncbi:MAG: radical SAM protein [Quinella sp. 1Q7]|nr:radical SAM protein [Quinella sp. 1Q7]
MGGCTETDLTPISFWEFRRLISYGELDGLIIAAAARSDFAKQVVQICKLYQIPNVGVLSTQGIYWLNMYKIFVPYLESDITEKCNLNCAGCCHFANFSVAEDFYPIENFRRDMSRIAQTCDVLEFHLLGGEPFTLKNLDEYLIVARQCFPKIRLVLVTNGTLIPTLPQKILDALRGNRFELYISLYPPTAKMLNKIEARLKENGIPYKIERIVKSFEAQMTLNNGHNPAKTVARCRCGSGRSIRNGKIYKCPIDAAAYKFAAKFNIKSFSQPTGIDIYAPNFSSMIERLDNPVELCYWCAEDYRKIPWQPTNNPRLEDWFADPDELKNFL